MAAVKQVNVDSGGMVLICVSLWRLESVDVITVDFQPVSVWKFW